MTTSASLLTSVYRTICAGTNVRLRQLLITAAERGVSARLCYRRAKTQDEHTCAPIVYGRCTGGLVRLAAESPKDSYGRQLRESPLYNGANRLYYEGCVI